MEIRIPENGVIKEQTINIEKEVSIIYGYNNSGKTSFLRVLNEVMYSNLLTQFILEQKSEMSVYIPTNRLVVSDAQTKLERLKDLEE